MLSLRQLLLLACSLACANAADCYLPNGDKMNSTVTYMCPTDGTPFSASMCCRSMDPSGKSGADKCVRAGSQAGQWLCSNDDGTLWRRGCSTNDWSNPGCVNLCAGSVKDGGFTQSNYDWHIHQCSDGSYCCDLKSGQDCCQQGPGVWIVNGTTTKDKPTATTASMMSAVSTAWATQTVTTTSAAAVSSDKQVETCAKPDAAIAGSVVGGLVVGAAIACAACFFMLRKRMSKATEGSSGGTYIITTGSEANKNMGNVEVVQLYGEQRHELYQPSAQPAELCSHRG